MGNLYVSTRSLTTTQLNNFENSGTNPLVSTTSESLAGDIINLGKLNATNITVEGRNVSFKNVSDVTVTGSGTINVRADATHAGYVHIGYANTANAATSVNNDEYATVTEPNLSKWTIKRTDSAIEVSPIKYMLVRTKYELQNMKNNLGGNYMLAGDIDASSMSFVPIGSADTHFNGEFDGLNYKINNLTINRPDSDYVGLFGYQGSGTIENVNLIGGSITGQDYVGSICGYSTLAYIKNVSNTGTVKGRRYVGGIVGTAGKFSHIYDSYNKGNVTAQYSSPPENVTDSYVGGIVGRTAGCTVERVFNTGNVTGNLNSVGGIVGGHFTVLVLESGGLGRYRSYLEDLLLVELYR